MKLQILALTMTTLLLSCEKEDKPVQYQYTNLNDTSVYYNHPVELDLDKDGEMDFLASTQLIGTSTGDHIQFRISSVFRNRILLQEEETPSMMNNDAIISNNDQPPYTWTAIGSAIIVERIIPLNIADAYWDGVWKNQTSKFLPVQLVKQDGKIYNCWIRISFSNDAQSKIILHDAAFCKTASLLIKAGQH
ncbi:hypothetical protein OCK74_20140 [Chitinophagaceae bacterium LB-8]|uniref:Lipoprotein n=1 Tax=Paraflavisolibacter caeni TaxID=2982496 RepID=A0A9X2XPI8_9BACT|nr:hypothetical protein [Paraflavisolibacter caeni]MCU7551443.1 hypothetical protein [Paraflavisolibacter caeni]